MTVTDSFLTEIAKAINAESSAMPNYYAFATGAISSIDLDATSLTGEIGTRESATGSRSGQTVTFSSTRSSASVIDTTNGDTITAAGMHNATSGDELLTGVVISGVTQTTNFDIDIETDVVIGR